MFQFNNHDYVEKIIYIFINKLIFEISYNNFTCSYFQNKCIIKHDNSEFKILNFVPLGSPSIN